MMKAVVLERANVVRVREVPRPKALGAYQALTRVVCASICNGTDLKLVHGRFFLAPRYPALLGHEAVGRVIEVGEAVRNFKPGDLVSRPRASPPPESGLTEAWGGFAEYGIVTDLWAMAADGLAVIDPGALPLQIPAPPDADPVTLTQMITLRETLSCLRVMGVGAGDSVVVFGTGPVGLAFSLLARQLGLHPVVVVGRRREPLERARAFGRATHVLNFRTDNIAHAVRDLTDGRGADWAIEAIGVNAVLRSARDCLARAGKMVLYGVPSASRRTPALRRGPHICPAEPNEGAVASEIFDLVARGAVPAREFVSHEMTMDDVVAGLRLVETRQAFKVLLWMDPAA